MSEPGGPAAAAEASDGSLASGLVSGALVSGDMVSGDMVSGDMVSGDMVSGGLATGAPATDGRVVVQLRGIRKRFGTVEVLKGIDLDVYAGEHVVVFGPSGSGKSTLLRTINLLEQPDAGSLRILGTEYGPAPCPKEERGKPLELRRQVGMVFQQFNLFPHLTALDNITLALRYAKGLDRPAAEERAAQALYERRATALGRSLPGSALGRPAAARRYRPCCQPRPSGDAVRRAHLRPRPRARW